MPPSHKLLANLLVCLLLMMGMTACHRTPDESRVRQGVEMAERAAEHADASALSGVLSDDFNGNNGAMERSQLIDLLHVAALRGESIHALSGPIAVEQNGDRYVARFTVTLTSGGKMLPAHIGVYQVETAWRKEGSEWRCYSATWTADGQGT
ncbi:nuclear transport factor 2 family protein [Dyella sp. C11]|uniref:nuclear transport factor 2 family protein n=1 Tax=Dyella sp. C11 TaxID=2126991 RepID=UPI000D64D1A3|nr:nuclear transport factor 2 family protein [Dyella sp. C11]